MQTSPFKAGLIKLAALQPASVCGTDVGVCILCSHCSPAHSVCEITQSNAKCWESRPSCLNAALAFTITLKENTFQSVYGWVKLLPVHWHFSH